MCMPFTISDLDLSTVSVTNSGHTASTTEPTITQAVEYPWYNSLDEVVEPYYGEVEPSQPVVDSPEMIDCVVAREYINLVDAVVETAKNFKADEARDPRSVEDAMHFYNLMCDLALCVGHQLRCTDARRDYDTIFFKDTSTGCDYMLKRC